MASPPKLFDQVRQVLRVRHYSDETEKSYIHWIKCFIAFHQMKPPREMGASENGKDVKTIMIYTHVLNRVKEE